MQSFGLFSFRQLKLLLATFCTTINLSGVDDILKLIMLKPKT